MIDLVFNHNTSNQKLQKIKNRRFIINVIYYKSKISTHMNACLYNHYILLFLKISYVCFIKINIRTSEHIKSSTSVIIPIKTIIYDEKP